jgi:SAM-dependent methyltransferase
MDCWTYYDRTPEEARAFAEGMTGLSGLATQAVVGVYDAGWAREIVDLGGSQGAFLQALLEKNVAAHGVLFDRPAVIEGARAAWTGSALGARVAFQAGDFFDAVPAGGDLYLLKHILHDWNDDECARILRNVRRAMKPGGRVVAVEMIIDEAGPPSPAPLLDLNMLVMLTGRERTADEFRTLFSRAELQLTRLLPTPSPFVVIEAEAPH